MIVRLVIIKNGEKLENGREFTEPHDSKYIKNQLDILCEAGVRTMQRHGWTTDVEKMK